MKGAGSSCTQHISLHDATNPVAPAAHRQATLTLQVLRVHGALGVLEVASPRIQVADHQAGGLPSSLGVPSCGRTRQAGLACLEARWP